MLSAILFASALSAPVPIEVGRFDEAEFPNAQRVERRMPHAELTHRVDKILASRTCQLPGQTKTRYNIVVPYAVLMQPSGAISKLVVKEIGCAPIELLVGQVAVELARAGDFKTSHQQGGRWYVSEVSFARGGEYQTKTGDDPNRVICRATEPVAGSRIPTKKVCRTIAEWKQHEIDLGNFRRDLQQSGQVCETCNKTSSTGLRE